ncbi:MAG: hypothetical protein HYX67_09175 [Candidatus Melainabacteria bacterium]|nr:hypothetical protein [Candidatus Melainabacteria bacterium]
MNKDSDGEPISENPDKLHWSLVHDPTTAGGVLHELCDVLPNFLLERLAEHRHAEPHTLVKLSMHEDSDVRAAVTENPNTPADVLRYMVKDESPDVRYTMAENHNLASELLESLCEDENPYVSSRAQKTILRLRSNKCVEGQFAYGEIYEQRFLEGL